jgi:Trypsin-like peptidase domain
MKKQSIKNKRWQTSKSRKGNLPKREKINKRKKTHKKNNFNRVPKIFTIPKSILGSENTINAFPEVVFPFLSIKNFESITESNYYEPEGTGFFIHENGLFVTAKHVPFYQEKPLRTFIAIHAYYKLISFRHVRRFVNHPTADIAIGFLDKYDPRNKIIFDSNLKYDHLTPNFENPEKGQLVKNFGYGGSSIEDKEKRIQDGNFTCQWGQGKISELYLEGRDKSTLPGATVEAFMATIGKASGGPVFNEKGEVIGVNSTSLDGEPPVSYFTPINKILELVIIHDDFGEIKVSDLFK